MSHQGNIRVLSNLNHSENQLVTLAVWTKAFTSIIKYFPICQKILQFPGSNPGAAKDFYVDNTDCEIMMMNFHGPSIAYFKITIFHDRS